MKRYTLGNSRRQVLEMISEKSINKIQLGDQEIALVRHGEVFQTFEAECPHRGASLIQGTLTDIGEIICPLHEYRFNSKTGEVNVGSCRDLKIYRNELTDVGLKIWLT